MRLRSAAFWGGLGSQNLANCMCVCCFVGRIPPTRRTAMCVRSGSTKCLVSSCMCDVQVGPLWRVALVLGLTGDLGTKHILANKVRCGGKHASSHALTHLALGPFLFLYPFLLLVFQNPQK